MHIELHGHFGKHEIRSKHYMMDLGFYKRKKVFLTGHTGFKGTWLCRILILAGADVTGYALEPPTKPSLFEETKTASQMKSIIGDIRDREQLKTIMNETKPDIVLHLAAQPLVRTSYKDPVGTYESNVMGTVNILESVRTCPSVKLATLAASLQPTSTMTPSLPPRCT